MTPLHEFQALWDEASRLSPESGHCLASVMGDFKRWSKSPDTEALAEGVATTLRAFVARRRQGQFVRLNSNWHWRAAALNASPTRGDRPLLKSSPSAEDGGFCVQEYEDPAIVSQRETERRIRARFQAQYPDDAQYTEIRRRWSKLSDAAWNQKRGPLTPFSKYLAKHYKHAACA